MDMKFIHIADVHYGMNPDSDKPWSRERAQAIKDTLAEVVRHTRLLDADCLFIAGDLFHRQPLVRDLKEVNYLFSTIPGVRVVIIAGNHDRIRPNSALLSFTWSSNVTYILSQEWTTVYFEDINTEILGFSYHTNEITAPLTEDLTVPPDDRIHILLAHGGDASHLPINFSALAAAGFSYAALGHIHKPQLEAGGSIAYPGSLEPLNRTESGKHGMIIGEISPTTHQLTSLELIPMAKASYIPLVVHITKQTTNMELSERIASEIEKRGSDNIYRFCIRGMRDPDIEFDLEYLLNRMRIVELIDETEPQYDFSALFAEHPSDMIGFYIQALNREEMSPVEKKALYYGINALLQTKDERSQP